MGLLHLLDDPRHYSPDDEVVLGSHLDRFIGAVVLIGWHQTGAVLSNLDPLDGVFTVNLAYRLAVVVWIDRAVDDDDVALVHAGVNHGNAVDSEKECRRTVSYKKTYEVELFVDVFCWRGEAGLHPSKKSALI
jgi:hypothetical protein